MDVSKRYQKRRNNRFRRPPPSKEGRKEGSGWLVGLAGLGQRAGDDEVI
jgi:hypothetical protein